MSTPQHYLNYKAKPGNQHKTAARRQCTEAIRTGELVRQPCETCGADKTEAHHDDYLKPLEVRWLCKSCHGAAHRGPRSSLCRRGHPLSGANLISVIEGGLEKRRCRACRARAGRARYERSKTLKIEANL